MAKLNLETLQQRQININKTVAITEKPNIIETSSKTNSNTSLRIRNKRQINYYIFISDYERFKDIMYTQRLKLSDFIDTIFTEIVDLYKNKKDNVLLIDTIQEMLKYRLESDTQCIRQSLLIKSKSYDEYKAFEKKHKFKFFEMFNLALNLYEILHLKRKQLLRDPNRKGLNDFASDELHYIKPNLRSNKIQKLNKIQKKA